MHVAVMFILMFGMEFVPPAGGISPMGMKVLGVFLGLIYAWMFVGMLWPSFVGLIALGLTGYCTVTQAFAQGFGNGTFLQIFFFFIIAAYAEHSGLSKKIALYILSRKALEGRPVLFVSMLFMVSYILGIFIMTYAVIFFVWTILLDICEMIGYEKMSRQAGFLFVGVLQAATLGGTILPYQVFPKVCMTALTQATGLSVDTTSFIFIMFVISLGGVLAYVAAGLLFRIDFSKFRDLEICRIVKDNSLKFETEQLIALAVVLGFTFVVIVSPLVPADSLYAKLYRQVGDFGVLVAAISIVCAVSCHGRPVAKFKDLAATGLNWDLLALTAATMAMGKAVMAPSTGIMNCIVTGMTPIFDGMSGILFLLACFVLMGLLTQVAHNLVLATTFIPIFASIALSLGMGESYAIVIALGLSQVLLAALVTPAASNRGALIYGYDWIGPRRAFCFGSMAVITTDLVVIIVGIPLALAIL